MSKEKPTTQSFLDNCEYISNDEDTVYIDEEALTDCMKQYANQRIIEELEKAYDSSESALDICSYLEDRVIELKNITGVTE